MVNDIFQKATRFNDDGAVEVALFSQNLFGEKGVFTENSAIGDDCSVTAMYDYDPTTYYIIRGATASTEWVKWEFPRKMSFKTIYATFYNEVAAGSVTITIDGSNDDSSWDTLATTTIGNSVSKSLTANNAKYKYIRLQAVSGQASGHPGWHRDGVR